MSDDGIIFADDLARMLGVSEGTILELARSGLPFAVSSEAPRRVVIDAAHLSMWKAAVNAGCCDG
jgi:hypothetical protein